jgi:hypothetical protein
MGFTSLEAAPPSGGFTPIEVPSTPPVKESGDGKHFYEEGFLGRAAKGLGEGVAKLVTDKATNEALAKKEAGDKKVDLPTPSFGESLKQMASQAAEHPLDTIGHFAEGMAADPELLFPGLWEFMPAKMAAIVAKGGATAEVAATATRAVAIGGVAETVAQLTEEGKLDPQKIANNAAMFGVMGGVTHAVIKGAGTGFTSLKDTIVKPKEETHEPEKGSSKVDPSYEKSKMKPSESVPEALARVKEEKRIAEGKPKSPLSVTKKDGSIHIDKEAATADFHNNFDYIFNPDSPTGKQKAEMMAQMGITRETFKEMVTTP